VLSTQSDDRLVDLVRDGNDRAFEAIVHRYRGPLLRHCRRFLAPGRAEDAVQQAFVSALGALRAGDAEINLRPWLYRIAHNSALNVLRQAGADHDEISEQIDGVETPPQAVERRERFRSVVAAVRDLPDRQRDAIVLQALEGRSYDEIATEMGVTGGAVRQLLNRARTTLRQGATALTPPALVARLGGVVDAPVAERAAQLAAGAGGGAAVAKVVAIVAATSAVVGGAADGLLSTHHAARGSARPAAVAAAAQPGGGHVVTFRARPIAASQPHRHAPAATARRSRTPAVPAPAPGHRGSEHSGGSGSGGSGRDGGHSGPGGGGSDDSSPTTTPTTTDDHSGSGSTGSGDSGSGSSGSSDGTVVTNRSDDSGSGSTSSGSGSGDSSLITGTDDGTSGGGTSGSSH
jgi:RNA polymerase sigma factor (sigma-70 family)